MGSGNGTTRGTKHSGKRKRINGNDVESHLSKERKLNGETANSNCMKWTEVGLLSNPLSLEVNQPIGILSKTLEKTDLNVSESRLLLTKKTVAASSLFRILSDTERALVHKKSGLKVRALDRHGTKYNMVFKFLQSNRAYRMIGDWSRFLRENDGKMRVGDRVEIWGFRIEKECGSEFGMTLLHYGDEVAVEDKEEEEEEISDERKCEEFVERDRMEVTEDEWTVVQALLELKGV